MKRLFIVFAGYAYTYPEPADKEAFVKEMLYDFTYDSQSALPEHWSYPNGYATPTPPKSS